MFAEQIYYTVTIDFEKITTIYYTDIKARY